MNNNIIRTAIATPLPITKLIKFAMNDIINEDTINKNFNDPKITVKIEDKEYEKFLKLAEKY